MTPPPPLIFPIALKRVNINNERLFVVASSSFAVILVKNKSEVPPSIGGQGVPSKVEGTVGHCAPACTFQWENHKNKVFHVLVSKYFQSLYFMLFILMKAMPRCILTTKITQNYTFWSQKFSKTLDFDDF